MLSVLVIEDEPSFIEALEVAFDREGFIMRSAHDGKQGLRELREHPPDVVLLDLMLPGMSGLDVLREIPEVAKTPVIVVSAKDTEADIVSALELGADDYITKPYSVRELVARIRAAARRAEEAGPVEIIELGQAVLDLGRHQLRLAGKGIDLPRKEFSLLRALMERSGRVATREALLEEVWGFGWDRDTKTLDQHIRRLRRKLEGVEGAPIIETVRGVGYRLTLG